MNLSDIFNKISFHPVVHLPDDYEVHDFNKDSIQNPSWKFTIGKYNEHRPHMYASELFGIPGDDHRDIHMGIDIGAPALTPVFTFYAGNIFCAAVNPLAGDYGGTIITEHNIAGIRLWALYGHLSHDSVRLALDLKHFKAGQILGWIGQTKENGGWPPHLHFQLSLEEPSKCDMPGVVSLKDRKKALKTFLDPRVVLGNIY